MLRRLLFIPGLLITCAVSARDTCSLRMSLLTATPGTELYSTFGHSALRVTDTSTNSDIIFNYGTFDFDDPTFYVKFMRGKLLYFVSVEQFNDYLAQYHWEKRGITEQVLQLPCARKLELLAFLRENAKEEKKYYKYDFVYDNCTTRLRDILLTAGTSTADVRPANRVSFRDLIHIYLHRRHQYWSKLGIDILLGAPLDKRLSNREAQFLPDYLMYGLDSSLLEGKPMVAERAVILEPTLPPAKKSFFTPLLAFSLLLVAVIALMMWEKAKSFLIYFDLVVFFLTGLLGLLLLFMWFGTDHTTTRNNLNLLWAFPANMIAAFFVRKETNIVRAYFMIYCLVLLLLLALWFPGPQEMNNALLPLVLLLFLRSFDHYRRK
ncbi:MAG TPA: DUF4105 domain-containing protein [Chitinophagaceae bacterium]|nr:DUF4105 domain-containing protein [Chitinophagaceae bacterium]